MIPTIKATFAYFNFHVLLTTVDTNTILAGPTDRDKRVASGISTLKEDTALRQQLREYMW